MPRRALLILVLVVGAGLVGLSYAARLHAEKIAAEQIAASAAIPVKPPKLEVTRLQVGSGESLGGLLQHAGLDGATIQQLLDAAQPVVNFRRLRAGQQLELARWSPGPLVSLRYRPDVSESFVFTRTADRFDAREIKTPKFTQVVTVTGIVKDSLFNAVIAAGEHPELAVRLADIFAWDLDFYTDPRPGDTFRLVFERTKYEGADAADYGQIFAAEYDNAGQPYRAVFFRGHDGQGGYYTADGKSLQKAFLRSPLKFAARITSHYTASRYHPILKRYMAHLGTDYAAPVGTPVQAVGHGRVEFAGRKGGDGNMVLLKHSNGYETYYLHLSRILVRTGQNVQQGQLVGLVGATGLATGPHLDFRMRRGGTFVNFERMQLPPATPVPSSELADFKAVRDKWLSAMAAPNETVVAQSSSADPAHAHGP